MLTPLPQVPRLCPTPAPNSDHLLMPRTQSHYRVVLLFISVSLGWGLRAAASLAGSRAQFQPSSDSGTHQGQERQQRPDPRTGFECGCARVCHCPKAIVTVIHLDHITCRESTLLAAALTLGTGENNTEHRGSLKRPVENLLHPRSGQSPADPEGNLGVLEVSGRQGEKGPLCAGQALTTLSHTCRARRAFPELQRMELKQLRRNRMQSWLI